MIAAPKKSTSHPIQTSAGFARLKNQFGCKNDIPVGARPLPLSQYLILSYVGHDYAESHPESSLSRDGVILHRSVRSSPAHPDGHIGTPVLDARSKDSSFEPGLFVPTPPR